MLNFFTNVVYNIRADGKLDVVKLDYVKPDIGTYLAVKWLSF